MARVAEAYKAVLEVYTPEYSPEAWAATQGNLGNTLCLQAQFSQKVPEEIRLLTEGVEAYRAALEIWTPKKFPEYYETTTNRCMNAENVLHQLQTR